MKAKRQLSDLLKIEHFDAVHCNTPIGGLLGRICGYKANDWAAHIEENELLFDGIFNLVCYILNGIYKLEKINSDEES